MRTFNYAWLRDHKWDTELLGLIAAIYKEAGKREMFFWQQPAKMEKFVEIAKIHSTEASNAIEGIKTTNTRLRQLVLDQTTPLNRNEQEIIGYRDILLLINENYDVIPITRNYILQLHKILYNHMNNPAAGRTKTVQNYINATYSNGQTITLFTPLAPYETPDALDALCATYNLTIENFTVEPLLIIPLFIHDFLCIHPFNDGNGRMSRLLTTLLLYQNGFFVGKYISLEAQIEARRNLYYKSLRDSQEGWHEGKEDILPFMKYLLGTILSAYKDLDSRLTLIERKRPAKEIVKMACQQKKGRFTKQDIYDFCPTLSISSVEGALHKMVISGELSKEGKGKNTCYHRMF